MRARAVFVGQPIVWGLACKVRERVGVYIYNDISLIKGEEGAYEALSLYFVTIGGVVLTVTAIINSIVTGWSPYT